MESHLLQMRGLKPLIFIGLGCARLVASFTDAWIETGHIRTKDADNQSRIFYRCVD